MKYVYPAIFVEDEGSIAVEFPDLKNCFTQGENMVDALEMASDVLSAKLVFMEDNGETIPVPTPIDQLSLEHGEYSTLVMADTLAYRKANSTKSVKKTLTIPSWLNEAAEKQSVNFSQVLQEALLNIIGIK
jgi:antitoxin HicB